VLALGRRAALGHVGNAYPIRPGAPAEEVDSRAFSGAARQSAPNGGSVLGGVGAGGTCTGAASGGPASATRTGSHRFRRFDRFSGSAVALALPVGAAPMGACAVEETSGEGGAGCATGGAGSCGPSPVGELRSVGDPPLGLMSGSGFG
jgi:hypothetical protein